MVRNRAPAAAQKKVVVVHHDRTAERGYLVPCALGRAESLDLLTTEGQRHSVPREEVKCVYFVREFTESFEPERKTFFSRPKLDGLWIRVQFRDGDSIEGIVSNDLLDILENGIQLTPPDLNGNSIRIFVPSSSVTEIRVLGVVGVARRTLRQAKVAVAAQSKLFGE